MGFREWEARLADVGSTKRLALTERGIMKAIAPVTTKADESVYEFLYQLIQLLAAAPGIDQTQLKALDHRLAVLRRQLDDQ